MFQKSKITGFFFAVTVAVLVAATAPSYAQTTGTTLGSVIQNIEFDASMSLPGVMSGLSYLMGLILGFIAILKLKAHVENPNQVPLSDSMKRFVAGGAFFALPFIMDVVRNMIEGNGTQVDYSSSGFNGQGSGVGLDAMIIAMMKDIFIPLQWIFGAFGYIAGIGLVMIGISRLLKSEQDGPRGPATIGTFMTFVVAGCLFSINSIIGYFSTTMFGDDVLNNNGVLQYTAGLGAAANHVHAVISAIVAFSIVIGWISLIRGFFIVRGVSEGNQQASMMAAITHLIGGVLAINLGSVIMAVQNTLGITQYGIVFN